jgi:hypothetical protein
MQRRLVLRMAMACGSMLAAFLASGAAHATWNRIGTGFSSTYLPGLVSRTESGDAKIDVYVINSNGSIEEGDFNANTNTLTSWTAVGGVSLSPASAVGWSSHREVFVLGTDLDLYHNWSDNYAPWASRDRSDGAGYPAQGSGRSGGFRRSGAHDPGVPFVARRTAADLQPPSPIGP